jgi:hypothetical protein
VPRNSFGKCFVQGVPARAPGARGIPVSLRVLKLHLLDELDFVDIAEIMNVKASTVRSQYVRGLERLRKSISKDVSHDTIKNK